MLKAIAQIFGTRRKLRLFIRGFATIVITVCGFLVAWLMEHHEFGWSLLPFVFLLLTTFTEFVLADVLAEKVYPYETQKKLEILEQSTEGQKAAESLADKLERIIEHFKACDNSQISGTVHILVDLTPTNETRNRRGLLQLTDYVGPHKGRKGRITTLSKGIIGRCVRTKSTEYVNFGDKAEYYDRMAREFGFSIEEAKSHATLARSYLAEPIFSDHGQGKELVGVLYFFSTETQVFPLAVGGIELKDMTYDLVNILKPTDLV
jgi:hypothetical protein